MVDFACNAKLLSLLLAEVGGSVLLGLTRVLRRDGAVLSVPARLETTRTFAVFGFNLRVALGRLPAVGFGKGDELRYVPPLILVAHASKLTGLPMHDRLVAERDG